MQGGFNASYNVPQGLPLVTHGHTFRLSTGDSSPKKAVSGSDSELHKLSIAQSFMGYTE